MTLKDECCCKQQGREMEMCSLKTKFPNNSCSDQITSNSLLHLLKMTFNRKAKSQDENSPDKIECACCKSSTTLQDLEVLLENASISNENLKYLCKCQNEFGFPMSQLGKQLPIQPIKYKALEAACHFIDNYQQKLLSNSPNLKLHCYRAVMEVFIRHVDPKLVLAAVRCKKIKGAAHLSFVEYAGKVFERLKLDFNPELLKAINYEALLAKWKDVVAYYALILVLGPVMEAIVLYDKHIVLKEQGFTSSLKALFDPKMSPRNFVLNATKENGKS